MCGVPGICEPVHPSDSVGSCCLGNVRLGGSHEHPPVAYGIWVCQYHGADGTTGHVVNQPTIEEFIWERRCVDHGEKAFKVSSNPQ